MRRESGLKVLAIQENMPKGGRTISTNTTNPTQIDYPTVPGVEAMAIPSFPFHSAKAVQAAAVLLDRERCRQMSCSRLLKLLYLADRGHLKASGRPILGGRILAMRTGPLHAAVYDLVKGKHPDYAAWSKVFHVEGRNIEMRHHPGNGELSKREIQTLLDVAKTYDERDDDELGAITHDLPEYRAAFDPAMPDSPTPISLSSVIDAIGCSEAREAILQEAQTVIALDRVFGGRQR